MQVQILEIDDQLQGPCKKRRPTLQEFSEAQKVGGLFVLPQLLQDLTEGDGQCDRDVIEGNDQGSDVGRVALENAKAGQQLQGASDRHHGYNPIQNSSRNVGEPFVGQGQAVEIVGTAA